MPKMPRHDVAKVLAERTLGRLDAKQFSAEVAAYLLDQGWTAELEPLLRDIMQYRAEHGIVEVVAVCAHPLSAGVRDDITAQVATVFPAAKQIIVAEELQPNLVGGVRLEFPNQQLDLSVRAKLRRFKQLTTA